MNEPLLLLADEPTGALDTQTSLEIMTLLERLNDAGLTIILVTHEAEIADCARRRLMFRDGRVISDRATTAPLRTRPMSLSEAGATAAARPASILGR